MIREADRLDPDVDHRSEGYQPQATGHTHETTVETPATGPTGTATTRPRHRHDPGTPGRHPAAPAPAAP